VSLPIHAVLPQLLEALNEGSNAVLVAPPGAGKTTAVAPALLGEPWCEGEILLLSPRRLAARAAAERMAELNGEPVGGTIGYATRLDSKRSSRTRILVLTEGIFRNRIQADPELQGVSAVLFDEVHERSLDSDFGLALALDAQEALRPELRLLAMSATLDGARFARLMGDAPVIESEGRSHPIELRHLGRSAEKRIEDEMAAAVRRAIGRRRGASSPSCRALPRSSARRSGWRGSPPTSSFTGSTGASIRPRSVPRSSPLHPASGKWCWPHRSPRPVSRSMASAPSSIAALRAGRATTAPPASPGSSPSGRARHR
jgi:ATP-dependent helicase HrpB